jgi:hypothetical protein
MFEGRPDQALFSKEWEWKQIVCPVQIRRYHPLSHVAPSNFTPRPDAMQLDYLPVLLAFGRRSRPMSTFATGGKLPRAKMRPLAKPGMKNPSIFFFWNNGINSCRSLFDLLAFLRDKPGQAG